MKNVSHVGIILAALLATVAGSACHPHNRRMPKASEPTSTGSDTSDRDRTRTEPADNNGGDIRAIGNDGLTGRDIANVADSGEGGPLADIRFDYDSSALTAAAQQTLTGHAAWLKDHAREHVALEGHCDERGTVEYNLALGEQRARAVYDYLVGLGVPASQMQTVSFGKERPLDTGHTEDSWAKNRRVHFAVGASR